MAQAQFAYDQQAEPQAIEHRQRALTVSIYADRAHIRDTMREDSLAAGFLLAECGALDLLLHAAGRPLGEIVLIDCPILDLGTIPALVAFDERAARGGAHLVVSTSMAALDDVFGCLDRSQPQILVEPSRAERVIALGRALARVPDLRLRELSDDDRLTLLRLTEQVGQIAERLERMDGGVPQSRGDDPLFRFQSPAPDFNGAGGAGEGDPGDRLVRASRPSLPDPRLMRRIIRQRQLRSRFFDGELFADPAWDILLDLTAARAEHTRVSVTSLCIASGVPPTTALRWIGQLTDVGLLDRIEDETDRRRAFIALSDKGADAMARYFAELGRNAAKLV